MSGEWKLHIKSLCLPFEVISWIEIFKRFNISSELALSSFMYPNRLHWWRSLQATRYVSTISCEFLLLGFALLTWGLGKPDKGLWTEIEEMILKQVHHSKDICFYFFFKIRQIQCCILLFYLQCFISIQGQQVILYIYSFIQMILLWKE